MTGNGLIADLPAHLAERVRVIQDASAEGEFVLYWLHNAVRGQENPSLDVALSAGKQLRLPVFVYHALSER